MKKILFVIIAALCMVACGGHQSSTTKTVNDSDSVDITQQYADSIDSVHPVNY